MSARRGVLLLAWGNPGRGDDGLGPALAARVLEDQRFEGLRVESDYQLCIEDAAEIARHDCVLFVDADRAGPGPFSWRRLEPTDSGLSFSSHSVTPGALLALSGQLFGREPTAWLLGIRGYEFDAFEEGLSPRAQENLAAAVAFLGDAHRSGRLGSAPRLRDRQPGSDGRRGEREDAA